MENGLKVIARKAFAKGPRLDFDFEADFSHAPVQVLFGPSGSGKSTFLRLLSGLACPDEGRIEFRNQLWFDSKQAIHLCPQLRRSGYVPQIPALFAHLTVAGNLAYASGRTARFWLERLQLDSLLKRYPHQLSGGQKQRVALARTLAREPSLLLLDEPFSSLDSPSRESLRHDLRELLRELRLPTLLVTHDRTEAFALGDEIHVLDQGRFLQRGPVGQVFDEPRSVEAARILGIDNIFPAELVEQLPEKIRARSGPYLFDCDTPRKNTPFSTQLPLFLSIRAEDIELSWGTPESITPNQLPARVVAVIPEGPLIRLRLDCGYPLTALLPRRSFPSEGIREGALISAHLRAESLRVTQENP